jgi:hypothetical protein
MWAIRPELRCGLKVKVKAVGTSAFRHGTPKLAALGKIARVVGDCYVEIEWVSALPTTAVGIV